MNKIRNVTVIVGSMRKDSINRRGRVRVTPYLVSCADAR
jgi:hypothetical protein